MLSRHGVLRGPERAQGNRVRWRPMQYPGIRSWPVQRLAAQGSWLVPAEVSSLARDRQAVAQEAVTHIGCGGSRDNVVGG